MKRLKTIINNEKQYVGIHQLNEGTTLVVSFNKEAKTGGASTTLVIETEDGEQFVKLQNDVQKTDAKFYLQSFDIELKF